MNQDNNVNSNIIPVSEELLTTYEEELRLPKQTIDRAREIRNKAIKEDLTQHRCYAAITAGIGLLACREQNIPRVASDFAELTHNDGKEITQHRVSQQSRRIKRELKIEITPTPTEKYLNYYGTELGISEETMLQAENMLETAKEIGLTEKPAPPSIAAGIIDAARRITNEDIIQKDIENVSHVTATQFRQYCQQIQTA